LDYSDPLDDSAKLRAVLEQGEVTLKGLFRWGSNYTFLATARLEEIETQAVYKPKKGEQPLWDFPAGTLAKREVAAYEVSEALGWGLVPLTVLRTAGPHGPGSIQLYLEVDPGDHYFNFDAADKRNLGRVVAFDVLTNNADRKSGHVLKDRQGKIWLIDNALSFHPDHRLRTVIWDLAGSPVPESVLEDLRRFRSALDEDEALRARLGQLLTQPEVNALRLRTTRLIENPCFPNPVAGRNYPWPPV